MTEASMYKEILLQHIKKAKKSHLLWLKRVRHLIQELPISEEMIPLNPKECDFGRWLYSEGIKFNSLPSTSKIILEIINIHELIHDIYFDIYEIYFIETKQTGIFKKLHFTDKQINKDRYATAVECFLELEDASNNLIGYMDAFEKSILSASENLLLKAI